MLFPLRYLGFGCLPFMLSLFGFSPVYWFFAFYFFAHPGFKSFGLALLGTLIGSAAFQVAAMNYSGVRAARELGKDKRMRNGRLSSVSLDSLRGVVPDDLWTDLRNAKVENSPLWVQTPNARGQEVVILVYHPTGPDAPWTPGSAFLGGVGHRVAILRDDPLKAHRPWSRFLLLHELAHVSSKGVALHIARWRYAMTILHAIITAIVLSSPLEHTWLAAFLVVAAVTGLQGFLRFEPLCESYADAAAFRWLGDDVDRRRVLELMTHETKSASRVFGKTHFHSRLWRDRVSSLEGPSQPSLFNPQGGTRFDLSVLPLVLASIAVSALAWYSSAPSWRRIATYVAWCILCQAAGVAFHLWAQYADAGVVIGLRERKLLPELCPEIAEARAPVNSENRAK